MKSRKKRWSLLLAAAMLAGTFPIAVPAKADTPQSTTLHISENADLKTEIEKAVDDGYTSATVYLSPGRYCLPQDDNQAPELKTASLDLTFIGEGENAKNEVIWVLNPDDPNSDNPQPMPDYDSAFRNSTKTFSFQNMMLEIGAGGYTGFHSSGDLNIENCIVKGSLWYCGGATATIRNTEFITGDYAIDTYLARKYIVEGCTFHTGKVINVYSDMKQDVEIIFRDNAVTEWAGQSAIIIQDHTNATANYVVRIGGTNLFTASGTQPNATTCSRWYEVGKYITAGGTVNTENGRFSTVYVDDVLAWTNGTWAAGHEHDYTDGCAENAYETTYTPGEDEWATDPQGKEVRYWEKACAYCGTVVDRGEIFREDLLPVEYEVRVNYLSEEDGSALKDPYYTNTMDTAYDVRARIPDELTAGEDHYVRTGQSGAAQGMATGNVTIDVSYALDNVGGGEDGEEPDNIPDRYQKKVSFRVVNGSWNDETRDDKNVYVTLTDSDSQWDENGGGALRAPAVGEKPDGGYQAGSWDSAVPSTVYATDDDTYVYTYEAVTAQPEMPEPPVNPEPPETPEVPETPEIPNIPETPQPAPVPDVFREDHAAYIVGYDDGLVRPEANITRAEVATVFFRLLSDTARTKYLTRTNGFTDVEEGMWFNAAVSTMAAMGVVNGYPDGSFQPNEPITRAEFVAIASRFDTNGNTAGLSFRDLCGHWALEEVNAAYHNGWVFGYEDGTFRPEQNITRAEVMALVNRVLQRMPKRASDLLEDIMVTWPDNADTTKWYYLDVQEATNSHSCEHRDNGEEYWTQLLKIRDWSALEE